MCAPPGYWTQAEDDALRAAVHNLTANRGEGALDRDIPWSLVAQQVGTRTHHQCRTHWYTCLAVRDGKSVDRPRWTVAEELALIDRCVSGRARGTRDGVHGLTGRRAGAHPCGCAGPG